MTVRVRFAPSPTGYLHVGGARTALFNWLYARHRSGAFLLRIEDTDRERSTQDSIQVILDAMNWLGLDWDEEVVFQSEGVERHRRDVGALLDAGLAYRDFVPPDEVARVREEDPDRARRFPRIQAETMAAGEAEERAAAGEPFAVRFRVPPGETAWDDEVYGRVQFDNDDLEDLVILRADGTPTYNLAVASDDAEMGITHVIRGDDHVSNTPKQIQLLRAMGRLVPVFGHVPIVLGEDGKRLSKRHGATAVEEYAREGILPDAMFNFLSLLGWSPGDDTELMERDEIVHRFSLDRVLRKGSVFDTKKLLWMNGQYLQSRSAGALLPLVLDALGPARAAAEERRSADPEAFDRLLDLLKVRSRTIVELAEQLPPYLDEDIRFDPGAVAKHWAKDPPTVLGYLESLEARLGAVPAWEDEEIEGAVRGVAQDAEVGAGKVIHPLRVALTGSSSSPGIFDVLSVLGRDRSLARIGRGIDEVRRLASSSA